MENSSDQPNNHSARTKSKSPIKIDQAEISAQAQSALKEEQEAEKMDTSKTEPADTSKDKLSPQKELTASDKQVVAELKSREKEVRQHEQAHKSAAGRYASGAVSYQYQQGPDGKRYAVGGHVGIDAGASTDPQQTMRKMDVVRRAALAPANPSAQDRSVAAAAAQTKNQAILQYRQEIAAESKVEDAKDAQEPQSTQQESNTEKSEPIEDSDGTQVPDEHKNINFTA
ncbi:MAG: catalase [Planctomycetes bacterium]|nr:catalase [Planctomycetota bacterium]